MSSLSPRQPGVEPELSEAQWSRHLAMRQQCQAYPDSLFWQSAGQMPETSLRRLLPYSVSGTAFTPRLTSLLLSPDSFSSLIRLPCLSVCWSSKPAEEKKAYEHMTHTNTPVRSWSPANGCVCSTGEVGQTQKLNYPDACLFFWAFPLSKEQTTCY